MPVLPPLQHTELLCLNDMFMFPLLFPAHLFMFPLVSHQQSTWTVSQAHTLQEIIFRKFFCNRCTLNHNVYKIYYFLLISSCFPWFPISVCDRTSISTSSYSSVSSSFLSLVAPSNNAQLEMHLKHSQLGLSYPALR